MAIRHHRFTFRIALPFRSLNFLRIILLLILYPQRSFCTETGIPQDQDPAETPKQKLRDLETLLDRQEIHLQKLQDLVKILDQAVDKLQPGRAQLNPAPTTVEPNNFSDAEEEKAAEASKEERPNKAGSRSSRASANGRGVTVAKYRPAWSERFQFLSAVKMESDVTCLNVLPHEGDDGVGKYVAVGDAQGRVYILLSHGDVLVNFLTLSMLPVTAMLSYLSVEKNETVLVTGHADGTVLLHRVWETSTQTMQHATAVGDDSHALTMEHVRVLSQSQEDNDPREAVVGLEVHQVGRMRYVLGISSRGRIHVFRENGTLYGVAESSSNNRPLAFLRQRLLFLTETGAGSLDLRSMTVRTGECDGLNGSRAVAYAFDAAERSKGYGLTSEGDLIHVMLIGDVLNFECRVKGKRRSEIEEGGAAVVRSIKGYLLVSTPEKVFVYNTTTQQYIRLSGPRPLFYASLDQIASAFAPVSKNSGETPALIACNRDRLVVIGFGDGYVGVYRSNLPVHKVDFNPMLWSTPVLVFVLFLIGAWHFFGKKKEAFAIWGPDDIFSVTPAAGSSLSGVSGERSNDDSSTRPEGMRDMRESLRGVTRRYVSPSGYPARQSGYGGGAGAISYRSSTVDPNYRPTVETKFRPQTVETSSYAKRREPLFTNSQVVEDNIH